MSAKENILWRIENNYIFIEMIFVLQFLTELREVEALFCEKTINSLFVR